MNARAVRPRLALVLRGSTWNLIGPTLGLSGRALLSRAGFADMAVLRGGMEQWNRAEFEIVRVPTTDREGASEHEDSVHRE